MSREKQTPAPIRSSAAEAPPPAAPPGAPPSRPAPRYAEENT